MKSFVIIFLLLATFQLISAAYNYQRPQVTEKGLNCFQVEATNFSET
jgi:hypothetical protein